MNFKTKFLGTGMYLPKKTVTNFDLEKTIDTNDQWIQERTGIKQRHISSHEGGEYPTDMALSAAKDAIERSGIDVDEIDCILFATNSPDYLLPNCATQLQVKLGMNKKCACLDVTAACSGFVYGLNIANSMIQTGIFKTVLLIGAETLSRLVNWNDRSTCILFGDGCGVALLGRTPENDNEEILSGVLGADGRGNKFLNIKAGGTAKPITHEVLENNEQYISMNGPEMFKVAVRTLTENALSALDKANLKLEDLDWIVPHQANMRIIEATAKRIGISMDKVIVNIDKVANTSAASVPIAFNEAVETGKIKRGDLVLFDVFGAGLTSGATIFRY